MTQTREELKLSTRRRVIDAARQLFQEHGFAATTVRDIAGTSGTSVGTVMAAGDKNALLVLIFDELIEAEHLQRSLSGMPESSSATVVDQLMALATPFVQVFTEHQDLARTYASILVSGHHSSILFTDLASRLLDEFQTVLAHDPWTPAADAATKAHALYFAYVGALFTSSARAPTDAIKLNATIRDAFDAICTQKEHP